MPIGKNISPRPYRGFIIGLVLSAIIGFGGEYSANHLGYEPAATYLPPVFLIPYLFLIYIPNYLLKKYHSVMALTFPEIVMIFAMGWIASMTPDQAMTKFLLVVITAPVYFATQENRWHDVFFEYLPDWLVFRNETAVRLSLKVKNPVSPSHGAPG